MQFKINIFINFNCLTLSPISLQCLAASRFAEATNKYAALWRAVDTSDSRQCSLNYNV